MGVVSKGEHAGKEAIQKDKLRDKLVPTALARRISMHMQRGGEMPDAATKAVWHDELWNEKNREIRDWQNMARGHGPDAGPAVWFDADPSGAHQGLREARGDRWYASKFIAPISAGLMGASNQVDAGPHTATYNEENFMGGLDWLTRLSVGTYLTTALRASGSENLEDLAKPWKWPSIVEAVGSDEQLNLIQQGHDIVSLAPELNVGDVNPLLGPFAALASATGWVDKDTITNLGDYGTALLISMFDLDAFMLIRPGVKLVQGASALTGAGAAAYKALGRVPGVSNTRLTQEASVAHNHREIEKILKVWDDVQRDVALTAEQKGEAILAAIAELPKGQQGLVDVLIRAVTEEVMPIKYSTVRVIEEAARKKAAYGKEFGKALTKEEQAATEAMKAKKAHDSTMHVTSEATPAAKKAALANADSRQVIAATRVAQLEHMAAVKVAEDLKAYGKLLARMGQRTDGKLEADSPAAAKIRANLQERAKDLQAAIARRGVAGVREVADDLDDPIEAAAQAKSRADNQARTGLINEPSELALARGLDDLVDKAGTRFIEAVTEASRSLGGKAEESLKEMLKKAEGVVAAKATALNKIKNTDSAMGLAPEYAKHEEAIARVRKAGGGEVYHKAYLAASRKVLGDLEESYRKLIEGAGGNVAALATASEAMLASARHVDLGSIRRQVLKVQRVVGEVLNPTVARHATTDEATQGLAQAMENSQRLAVTDMANLPGRTLAETLENANTWVSTNETVVGASGRASQLNSKLELPIWELAKPYLRALIGQIEAAPAAAKKLRIKAEALLRAGTPDSKSLAEETLQKVKEIEEGARDSEKMLEAMALAFHLPESGDIQAIAGTLGSSLKKILMTGSRNGTAGTEEASRAGLNLTYNELMVEMMRATDEMLYSKTRAEDIVGAAFAKEQGRATAIMLQAISHSAITNRASTQLISLVTEAGVDLSPAVMRAMEDIGKGQGHKAGAYLNDAMAAFAVLGMDPTAAKLVQKTAADVRAGVIVIQDQLTKGNIFAAQRMTGLLGEQLTDLVKTQEAITRGGVDPSSAIVASVFSALSRWINTSLLTGNIFNNPGYFARNQIGDGSMMWAHPDVGAYMAAKVARQSAVLVSGAVGRTSPPAMALYAFEAIPGIGPRFKRARAAAADRLGVVFSSVLPTLTEVLINPRLNMVMDTRLAGSGEVYTVKVGKDTTYGQVRAAILDERITTSFASVSGLTNLKARSSFEGGYIERAARAAGVDVADVTVAHVVKNETDVLNKAIAKALGKKVSELTKADYLQAQASSALFNALMESKHAESLMKNLGLAREEYAHVADMYDTHQRTLLFMELIDQGHSFRSAGKIVREALLDWASPASTMELQHVSKVLMFWHYQRRAMGRGFSLLVSPFVGTNADDSIARSFLKGSTVWSALAGEVPYTTAALRDMTKVQHAGQEYMRSGEEYDPSEDPALRGVYMWFLNGQDSLVGLNNFPLTPYEQDANIRYGRKYTHKAMTAPAFEPLALADFWMSQASLLAAWAVNDAVGTSDVLREEMMGMADMGGRVTGPMLTGVVEEFMGGGQARYAKDPRAGIRVNRFFDRAVLGAMNKVPVAGDFMYEDTDGGTRSTPGALAAYRIAAMPFSIEFARWAEPLMEAHYTKENMSEVPGYVMRQWTGIGAERYHTPADTLKYARKEVYDKVGARIREDKKIARPK